MKTQFGDLFTFKEVMNHFPHGLLDLMKSIQYGYVDREGKHHSEVVEKEFYDKYRLQSPDEVWKSQLGVCWDQVELEREAFMRPQPAKIFTIQTIYVELKTGNSHTFLVYKKDNNFYWFEHSYGKYKGIHGPFTDIHTIIALVIKHMQAEPGSKKSPVHLVTQYTTPSFGCTCREFMINARNGVPIGVNRFLVL